MLPFSSFVRMHLALDTTLSTRCVSRIITLRYVSTINTDSGSRWVPLVGWTSMPKVLNSSKIWARTFVAAVAVNPCGPLIAAELSRRHSPCSQAAVRGRRAAATETAGGSRLSRGRRRKKRRLLDGTRSESSGRRRRPLGEGGGGCRKVRYWRRRWPRVGRPRGNALRKEGDAGSATDVAERGARWAARL